MTRNSDYWLSFVVLGLCAIASVLTVDGPASGTGGTVGPNFLPWLMIGGMSLFALVLLWRSQRQTPAAQAPFGARLLAQLGGFLLLMLAYAWAYEPVGYLISSVVFFVVALLLLGERRLLQLLLVPPGVVGAVYVVFTHVLQVYMP
jgi:putative tricarboxylic transport membrane protein